MSKAQQRFMRRAVENKNREIESGIRKTKKKKTKKKKDKKKGS